MDEFKLIVAGGRDFTDAKMLDKAILDLAEGEYADKAISIVSGMARGADMLGYMFAVNHNVVVYQFPAEWDKYGKRAGFIRNKQMGDFADGLLAFWDGSSKGTKQMIEYMQSLQKPVHIVRYAPQSVPLPERPARHVGWDRKGAGYECSSKGDKRFSALFAVMPDGRTIEQHYQCDVKGYQPGGTNWRLGKGKPPMDPTKDMWVEYLALWQEWAKHNPGLIAYLAENVAKWDYQLKDTFASTPVNQARALATILNSL